MTESEAASERRARRSRARATRQEGLPTSSAWRRVVVRLLADRDGMRCFYCHKPLQDDDPKGPGYAQVEHLIPTMAGGKSTPENIHLSCQECNDDKHRNADQGIKRLVDLHGLEEAAKLLRSEKSTRANTLRRQFDSTREVTRLDKRAVRHARFKMLRINITITDELLAAVDARATMMNYGRGMNRSEFIGYVLGAFLQKGSAAREFRRMWREQEQQEPGGEVDTG